MDKKSFAEIEERLLDVNKVIAKLDASIRVAAFDFLKPYVSTGIMAPSADSKKLTQESGPHGDVSDLIQKHGDGKPHENVNLLAALWFSEYGSYPFSSAYIREKADSTGLTVPARPDMSLKGAKEKGKSLYLSPSKGFFKPTVVGEAFLKTTYGVRKGTKTPPSEE